MLGVGKSEGQGQGYVQELTSVHVKRAEGRSTCCWFMVILTNVNKCLLPRDKCMPNTWGGGPEGIQLVRCWLGACQGWGRC